MLQRTLQPTRVHLSWQLFEYNLALIVVSSAYYIFKGFDPEEFSSLMGLLSPITALYLGASSRYIGKTLKGTQMADVEIPGVHAKRLQWGIRLHFILILLLISLKALFNWITFQEMMMLLTLLEASFGGYIGFILLATFGEEKQS